jgi:hypothetical protein
VVKKCFKNKLKKIGVELASSTPRPATADSSDEQKLKKINERLVYVYIGSERIKPRSDDTIIEEYTQKVILFGYITVRLYRKRDLIESKF